MSIPDMFYLTATIVLIAIAASMAYVGWRIYGVLQALHALLSATRETLTDIKETPRKLQNGVISSAVNIARIMWGRG